MSRPQPQTLIGRDPEDVPMSLQRILHASSAVASVWIGPNESKPLSAPEREAYDLAHNIMAHLCIQAPLLHKSGHPGGPLSAFTFAYFLRKRRDSVVDQPLRMSAGHLSLLAYGLEWIFRCEGDDVRLRSPQAIIECFRTPKGLPGHIEAGIGSIPFGSGPLGKGVSNALGVALGLKLQGKPGVVDVLMGDGDSQEGQIMEAFRLATHRKLDNLVVHGDFNDMQLSDMPSRVVAADFARIAEATGWQVIEVQNGNDPAQVKAAQNCADTFLGKGRPIFIAYYTTMGHGVRVMEEGSNTGSANYHGTPLRENVATAALRDLPPLADLVQRYEKYRAKLPPSPFQFPSSLPPPPPIPRALTKENGSMRTDFGAVHVKALMDRDPRIVVLHADLAGSGGFDKTAKTHPTRVINVGVAEANMTMMASGLRQVGMLPITYTFAAFGTNEARANARLIDINCAHVPCAVLYDCTHAGVNVGEDGETHQEQNAFNIPFRHTQVWTPVDSNQAAAAAERGLAFVAEGRTSVFLIFPREGHPQLLDERGEIVYGPHYVFTGIMDRVRGKGDTTDQITIVAAGHTVHDAVRVADDLARGNGEPIRARVLAASCIRPFDASSIIAAALETRHLVVLEDHNIEGGLASQVADAIADFSLPCSLRRLGLNTFFPSGNAEELRVLAGIDPESIRAAVLNDVCTEVYGGLDALVSCLVPFSNRLSVSHFRETALPYLDRLRNESGYLESLYAFWSVHTCPPEKLPSVRHMRSLFV